MPILDFISVRIKILLCFIHYLVLGLFVTAASVILTNMLSENWRKANTSYQKFIINLQNTKTLEAPSKYT